MLYLGSYSDFESIKHDKDLMTARQQASLDKERKHIEDTIRRMQVMTISVVEILINLDSC